MSRQSISVSQNFLALVKVLCRDIIFYVAIEYGQMRGVVLRQGILGCDIVGQAGKMFCCD